MEASSHVMGTPNQEIRIKKREVCPTSSVHLLPCKIVCDSEDGCDPARVDTYFTPVIRPTNEAVNLSTATDTTGSVSSQVFTAPFRGRGLKGVKVNVPEGFSGYVLRESSQSPADQGREFEVCGQFSDFMYWNLQSTPTADDKLIQAMTWSKLAQTLHKPLPVNQENSNDTNTLEC